MKLAGNSAMWANYPGELLSVQAMYHWPFPHLTWTQESAVWMVGDFLFVEHHSNITFADGSCMGSFRLHQRRELVEDAGMAFAQGSFDTIS
jgi:hypothetical protein